MQSNPHFAGGCIQRGGRAEGVVALVFETVTLCTPESERRHPALRAPRMIGGFLVHAERHPRAGGFRQGAMTSGACFSKSGKSHTMRVSSR